jgi:membrane dipeptidase
MSWGVLGIAGCGFLVREAADLDRLPGLFLRGVRVWQPVGACGGVLGGADVPGDDRGLTALGRAFLDRLVELAGSSASDARPILDLAGMNAATAAETLHWYDALSTGRQRVLVALTHGSASQTELRDGTSAGGRVAAEIRARGGVVGLTPGLPGCETADAFKALIEAVADVSIPGRTAFEGIAVGTDLLEIDQIAPGLGSAREIARWLGRTFDRRAAFAIAAENARALLLRSIGIGSHDAEGGPSCP